MSDALTLLVVDDDATTRDLLVLLLSAEGWQVSEAACGEDALAAVEAGEQPDVILSDLQMPGLSGTAMALALREKLPSAARIIAMTASATITTPQGFDNLLVKPFAPADVLSAYRALQERSPQHPQIAISDAVIEPETLSRLRANMAPEQAASLYAFALNDATERVRKMEAAAIEGDDETYRKQAHALKGSCGMIGAQRLRGLADTAEMKGTGVSPLTVWNEASQFAAALAEIRLMLKRIFPGRD